MAGGMVPFGKYRGQPVEVLANDRQYVDWLMGQDWFRDRYQPLYQVIINNFGAPAETPEHNALQARFLDDGLCVALLTAISWPDLARIRRHVEGRLLDARKEAERQAAVVRRARPEVLESWEARRLAEAEAGLAAGLAEVDRCEAWLAAPTLPAPQIQNRSFEHYGWDVRFEASVETPIGDTWMRVVIELKPSLGDDYPAVLRQMTAAYRAVSQYGPQGVLVFDQFAAVGATREQVDQIFQMSGFGVVSVEQLTSARCS